MKNYKLLISAIVFFILANTWVFWEGNLGAWSMLIFFGLAVFFFALLGAIIWELFGFTLGYPISSNQLFSLGLTAIVLITTCLLPAGVLFYILPTQKENAKFVALAEGAANCMTTFKLFENNRFMERNMCFSTNETWGKYAQRGDTLFFSDIKLGRDVKEYYLFAIIKMNEDIGNNKSNVLYRYKDANDTAPRMLFIRENQLK
ncbi:hypothetical protein BH09BAC1_BH09BAC1_15280 [soil metagenome]